MSVLDQAAKVEPRSPLREPPLRVAGHSLREKLFRGRDGVVFYAGGIVVMAVITILTVWWVWWLKREWTPWIVTATAMAMGGFGARLAAVERRNAKNLELGLDGEVAVGQMLERLRSLGYEVLHDLPGEREGTNIDHVLIGPAGVFTVETKTRSKRGNQQVRYDGRTLRIGKYDATDEVLPQARACRDDVRRRIRERLGRSDIPVRGVVVFPGWWVDAPTRLVGANDIWVLNPKLLPLYLDRRAVLSEQMAAKVVGALVSGDRA